MRRINIEVGQKIAFASTGAELKDGHTGQTIKLKTSQDTGVESADDLLWRWSSGSLRIMRVFWSWHRMLLSVSLLGISRDAIIDLDVTPTARLSRYRYCPRGRCADQVIRSIPEVKY
jgi:hypothetical protein